MASFIFHISDIEFSHNAAPIDLIFGVQSTHLHTEEAVRQGRPFEPVGKCSKLSGFVIGSDSTKGSPSISPINFVEKINMKMFYQFETLGVQAPPNLSCPETVISPDDKRALNLFESSCNKEGNRYIIGLPWKTDCLPDKYVMAERRLLSNEVKAHMRYHGIRK